MKPENILVRMPNWVGDLVMAIPVLIDMRKAFPKARITALCKAPLSDLLKEESAIDELFSFKKPENQFLYREDLRNIIGKIEAGQYDTGVLLTNSLSSAWWFYLGNVKRRIGYSGHFRRWLLTDVVNPAAGKEHQVLKYKRLLSPLGIPPSQTAPRILLTDEEIAASKIHLLRRGYKEGTKIIGINPGAAFGSAKCWPPENFRNLTERLLKESDASIVFFGDSPAYQLVKDICSGLPDRVINLAGVTTLRELACTIRDVDVLVTNDSGPMHIGAALGIPLVALFGSTDEEATGPYGQEESVINKKASCSPCFKRTCPIDFRCMREISVGEVVQRVHHLLKRGS
jgi:heptosyltransferase II